MPILVILVLWTALSLVVGLAVGRLLLARTYGAPDPHHEETDSIDATLPPEPYAM